MWDGTKMRVYLIYRNNLLCVVTPDNSAYPVDTDRKSGSYKRHVTFTTQDGRKWWGVSGSAFFIAHLYKED